LTDDLTNPKFVDVCEFINNEEPSRMDVNLTQLLDWSVNVKKTKEMIISSSNN